VARAARERKSQIDGTMFWREGRKTQCFHATIVPRLSHAAGVARRKTEMKRSKIESQCLKGNAGKRREFGCGIKTRVRLPEQVFCVETRRRASRKGAKGTVTSSEFGVRSAEWGMGRRIERLIYADWALICDGAAKAPKARKAPKAPKITARITAGAAGRSGSWARRST